MKEKGFTLIELLAVIVILAIIALIAVPIVIDIIEDSKREAKVRSAENYLKEVELAIAKENLNREFNPINCDIMFQTLYCDGTPLPVEVDGEIPESAHIYFQNGTITNAMLYMNPDYVVVKNGNDKLRISKMGEPHKITFTAENGTVAESSKELVVNSPAYLGGVIETFPSQEGYVIGSTTCTNGVTANVTTSPGTNYATPYIENVYSDAVCTIHYVKGHEITFLAENGTAPSEKYYGIGSVSATLTPSPNEGYAINSNNMSSVTCTNGVTVMPMMSGSLYVSLSNVYSDAVCTIHYEKGYEITLEGVNGTVTPNKYYAIENAYLNFESHPNEGYAINPMSSVTCTNGVNGYISGTGVNNYIYLYNINSDTVCTVTFEKAPKITLKSDVYSLQKTEFYGFNEYIMLSELGISDADSIPIYCDNGYGYFMNTSIAQMMYSLPEAFFNVSAYDGGTTCTIG
ncbi:MAG: prepilin-type N-terminal cleavage/methylation domain-containing protein [bacterium]|nr:prepilin-type N-terminal cleavage/methylation domain-containing protein [bacterium]